MHIAPCAFTHLAVSPNAPVPNVTKLGRLGLVRIGVDIFFFCVSGDVACTPLLRYRETTCRANTSCLLWELKMTDLHQVVHVFPHVMEDLRLAFLAYLKDAIATARMQQPEKCERC